MASSTTSRRGSSTRYTRPARYTYQQFDLADTGRGRAQHVNKSDPKAHSRVSPPDGRLHAARQEHWCHFGVCDPLLNDRRVCDLPLFVRKNLQHWQRRGILREPHPQKAASPHSAQNY